MFHSPKVADELSDDFVLRRIPNPFLIVLKSLNDLAAIASYSQLHRRPDSTNNVGPRTNQVAVVLSNHNILVVYFSSTRARMSLKIEARHSTALLFFPFTPFLLSFHHIHASPPVASASSVATSVRAENVGYG